MEETELEEPRLTAKGQATRRRIVQAAADLIFRGGVAGVSIEDIQEAADVSASQLYHYFRNKQELAHAVIELQTQSILDGQQPVLGDLTSFEAFRAWRDLLVAVQKSRHCLGGCPLASMANELSDSDAQARSKICDGFDRWETPIRNGLTVMKDKGILTKEADPAKLALAMMAALQGGLLLTQVRHDTEPLEVALDAMIRHIQSFQA